MPRGARTIDPANLCPTADRCVASAILNDARDLATAQDPDERLRLLKSLGHWVGDIHQPLHVSFEDDKGANFIEATGDCAVSLHLAWDICIVEKQDRQRRDGRRGGAQKRDHGRRTAKPGRPRASTPPPSLPGRTSCWPLRKAPSLNIASGMLTAAGTRLTQRQFSGTETQSRDHRPVPGGRGSRRPRAAQARRRPARRGVE